MTKQLDRRCGNELKDRRGFHAQGRNFMERSNNQARPPREEGEYQGTHVGKVKHVKIVNDKFAYGFIVVQDATISDVFVHYRDIEPWREGFKELKEGEIVKFDLHKTSRGLQARNVEVKREPLSASLKEFKTVPESFGNK